MAEKKSAAKGEGGAGDDAGAAAKKKKLMIMDMTSMLKSWTQKHPSMNLGSLRIKCQKQMNGNLMHMINISLHR